MKRKYIFVIAISLFFANLIFAQNYNDALRLSTPGFVPSARVMGMGGAAVGLGGDYSSAFTNPAGLGLIKQSELVGGLNYSIFNNNTTLFNSQTSFDVSSTGLNQVGFAFPFPTYRGSFVIAFGYNRIKDFNSTMKFNGFNSHANSMIQDLVSVNDDIAYNLGLSYPTYDSNGNYLKDETKINGNLNQRGNLTNEGSINAWTLSAAIEVAKNVFVGASFNILTGTYKSRRDYYEEDTKDKYPASVWLDPNDQRTSDFQSFYLNDIVNWDLTGWNAQLGILYKMNLMDVGFGIKLPSKFTVKEKYFVYGESYFGSGNSFTIDPPYNSKVEYDINTPWEFSGGASFGLAFFRVNADAVFIDYTQMEFAGGLNPTDMSANNNDIKELFRSVVNYSFGGEFDVPVLDVTVRAGYALRPSPFKDDPPNFDRKYYTFGLGLNPAPNIFLDFAIVKGSWNDFSDNYGTNLSRVDEDIQTTKAIFTVKYRY